jgi:glycosyltransferase involved in cell wall biosynthesis
VRVLVVSQMYPGPSDPDLGVFVAQLADALAARGHELELAVLDSRGGGKKRYLALARKVRRAARPDVVWAHFLVPAGLIASSVDAPLVVTAHGRDVRNIGTLPGIAALSRRVVSRASTVIAVSDYLRRELELRVPEARGKTVVIDSGVDLERFAPRNGDGANRERPAFLAVGTLSERKNVVRLAEAFERLGRGSLAFVGEGPLRPLLEGRERVLLLGRVSHSDVPQHMREADVLCAPSLLEPFGQSILEGMAAGKTVVATRFGGPPEFVTPEAGILVDPLDLAALSWALEAAAAFPAPNLAARAVAAEHDVRIQAERVEAILLRAVQDRRA